MLFENMKLLHFEVAIHIGIPPIIQYYFDIHFGTLIVSLHSITKFIVFYREHVEYRRNELLRKIIYAWRKDTKDTLEKEVFNFTTSLTLDSSIGSCLGSTFRSTLGSSYHSDALSTSGYVTDVRMRRGSGPVPVQYLKIDDRDDEVSYFNFVQSDSLQENF